MSFLMPKLPYEINSLSPNLSKETFEFHFGKHLKTYVDNLNKFLEDSPFKGATLEEIVKKSSGGLFNNSAQCWNHVFYFYNISPNSADHKPSLALTSALEETFGSRKKFLEQFQAQALANFGSGWTWLVKDQAGKLSIVSTSNAETPITKGLIPLLTVDIWEHAYYIDYRNARKNYLEAFNKILNWKFASERFEEAKEFEVTKLLKA